MSAQHPVTVTPFQLKLKQLCIAVETLFECRRGRVAFLLNMIGTAALYWAIMVVQARWLAARPWPLLAISHLGQGLLIFWAIIQVVRRLHDLGRTGKLFWAIVIPPWVAWRVADLFHLTERPSLWELWIVLGLMCLWTVWLILQLIFRPGSEGPNGYDGRDFYKKNQAE